MARVHLPVALQALADGQAMIAADGQTVRQVIANLEGRYPGLQDQLRRGHAVRPGLMVAVGSQMGANLLTAVGPDEEIHFLPALGGG